MSSKKKPLTSLILLDGGLGTTLSLPPHSYIFTPQTPLWSSHLLLSPTSLVTLSSVQRSFATAGAEVLLTDTYQASFSGFERTPGWEGGEAEVGRCMRGAVGVARAAFGGGHGKVALSLGPYGATMSPGQEYSGRYDEEHREVEQLSSWHLNRLSAYLPLPEMKSDSNLDEEKKEREESWMNVDIIAFETVPLLKEVQAIIKVMNSVPDKLTRPYWIVCVFPGEENALPDGSSVRELVRVLLGRAGEAIPTGIGLNCTKVGKVEGLVGEFERAVEEMVESGEVEEWPSLVLYPDGTDGEVYNTTTMTWEQKGEGSELPWDETFFSVISTIRERRRWKSIFVGGCCKTTPDHIGKLRKRIHLEARVGVP